MRSPHDWGNFVLGLIVVGFAVFFVILGFVAIGYGVTGIINVVSDWFGLAR